MKYIVKKYEPKSFANWKALANENWQPTYDDLKGQEKVDVKSALMAEQGYICCYCERQLIEEDSHVEHFKPQSDESVDPLDFNNMLCSCQNQVRKKEPLHCGNLKDNWFDDDLLVSPLAPDCEARFAFTGNGEIRSASENDKAANETIKKLGLNIPKLNEMRAKTIEPFLDESLSPNEFCEFVRGYLNTYEANRFGAFWTTIRHLFGESTKS